MKARDVDGLLRGVGANIAAVLFYGRDAGLVRERAERLVAAVAGDGADPFAVSEVSVERLREEPSALLDEAAALSFGGGRRVVRLRGAGDAASRFIAPLFAASPGGLLVVEAEELPARSSLRQMFEASEQAIAAPCYQEEGADLRRFIIAELQRAKLGLAADAEAYLLSTLGGDRAVTRREVEKLALYMGAPEEPSTVTLADAMACIGDSSAQSTDDLALAVADGDVGSVERLTGRVLQEGTAPVAILRVTSRHFMRLHRVAADPDRERALRSLRPPVFYKHVPRLHAQLRWWSAAQAQAALSRLLGAELDCKRTGTPAETVCRRRLLEIAMMVARRGDRAAT